MLRVIKKSTRRLIMDNYVIYIYVFDRELDEAEKIQEKHQNISPFVETWPEGSFGQEVNLWGRTAELTNGFLTFGRVICLLGTYHYSPVHINC